MRAHLPSGAESHAAPGCYDSASLPITLAAGALLLVAAFAAVWGLL